MCCVVCVLVHTQCVLPAVYYRTIPDGAGTLLVYSCPHHAPLCCTCGVDCERSCNVDVVHVADICDTGGCRRRCTAGCSTAARVAAEVVQSIHWLMKPIRLMSLQNYDANYVSDYNVYNSTGGGSSETIDGWQVRIPYIGSGSVCYMYVVCVCM